MSQPGTIKKNVLGCLFPSSKSWLFWLSVALLFKGVIFFLQLHDHTVDSGSHIPGYIGGTWGDSMSYIDPAESFVAGKGYDSVNRLPGYSVFFIALRYFLSIGTVCNIVIIMQYVISAISVYALALSAKNIFKSEKLFFVVFYLYVISTFANGYDSLILTESFTTSFLVFTVYFYSRYYTVNSLKSLFLSGLFLTWVIFMRPVYAPLLALFGLLTWLHSKKIKVVIMALLAFIIVDVSWMVRNFSLYKRILPLAKSMYYFGENSYYPSVLKFCESWGGHNSPTQIWLLPELSDDKFDPQVPEYIYTSKFNYDSLKNVRNLIKKVTVESAGIPKQQQDIYTALIKNKLSLYTLSIKQEKPMLYYVKAPWLSLKTSVMITYYSIIYFNWCTIFWSQWFYWFTLIAGLVGIILLLKPSIANYNIALFYIIPVFTLFIHAIVFKVNENRYIVPSYPFIVVCAAYALFCIYNKLRGPAANMNNE